MKLSRPKMLHDSRYQCPVRLELKRSGNPIPSNDTWIAALARQHAFPVLSNDVHFGLVEGIERIAFES